MRRDVFITAVDLSQVRSLAQAESKEYQSIYFKNSKIGYVVTSFTQLPEQHWLLEQYARMHLNVAENIQQIELKLKAKLSKDNLLRDFELSFQSPFYQMVAAGTVNKNAVTYHLTTATSTIKETLQLGAPPLLATSRRPYLLGENMQVGEKKRIPWFDPVSLTGKESILTYFGKESVLLNGRVHKLHRFVESYGGARVNFWLNNSGTVVKEESPAGFVFIREPQFKALQLGDTGQDILTALAVKIQGQLPDLNADVVKYRLGIPSGTDFDLHGGRQLFQNNILTITREDLTQLSPHTQCRQLGGSLDATAYIQSDHHDIKKLAAELAEKEDVPVNKVKRLATWVYTALDKRPVLGLPDALSTLKSKQGDCNEHAALFAALARSAQIPTRIVAGVTLHNGAFYYHAWNEVCLGGNWISIDTSMNQFPADLSHIKFVQGETQEQVRIGSLLGKLTIEPLSNR